MDKFDVIADQARILLAAGKALPAHSGPSSERAAFHGKVRALFVYLNDEFPNPCVDKDRCSAVWFDWLATNDISHQGVLIGDDAALREFASNEEDALVLAVATRSLMYGDVRIDTHGISAWDEIASRIWSLVLPK